MDKGYDFQKIYDYVTHDVKAQPIIAYNPRAQYAPPEGFNEKFEPICSMGYPLTYWEKMVTTLNLDVPKQPVRLIVHLEQSIVAIQTMDFA